MFIRVEIPAYTDMWMRGARFGEVREVLPGEQGRIYVVKLDHPQAKKLVRVRADHCREI